MKQGIYIESNREYHGYMEAVSKSRLCNMSRSPQFFRWCEDNQEPPTAELIFGSAFHKWVLEEETFYDEFVVLQKYDRRTREGKAAYELEMSQVAEGKSPITEDDFIAICGMKESILSNKYARRLLQGHVEESFYTTDELTGEPIKARPDVLSRMQDLIVITDLKSTRSAMMQDFSRDVVKYSYDLQAFWYTYVVHRVLEVPKDKILFCFIAVEKKPPYLVNIMQADSYILERGEAIFREYIGMLDECHRTGIWYGLNGPQGVINSLSLPAYLIKQIND